MSKWKYEVPKGLFPEQEALFERIEWLLKSTDYTRKFIEAMAKSLGLDPISIRIKMFDEKGINYRADGSPIPKGGRQ